MQLNQSIYYYLCAIIIKNKNIARIKFAKEYETNKFENNVSAIEGGGIFIKELNNIEMEI